MAFCGDFEEGETVACRECGLVYHTARGHACPAGVVSPVEFQKGLRSGDAPPSAWAAQEGGAHYKDRGIQPMRYSMANGLDALQHSVVKYVTRFRDKGGVSDLKKARHCLDMLIEWEETGGNVG